MLQSNLRYVLHFDLAMSPYPSDAPAIKLGQIIPYLKERVKNGESYQVIDNGRRVIRLLQVHDLKTDSNKNAIGLLFCLGDRNKALPGFTDFDTGIVRLAQRKKNEVGGLSVHAVVSLEPVKPNGHIYRMLYEDVSGFGKTLLQRFLRHEFKEISDSAGFYFEREGRKDPIKTRPLVMLDGHPSDTIKNSLSKGTLMNVELVQHINTNFGFDEAKYVNVVRQNISISVSRKLPQADGLTFVQKMMQWARRRKYDAMRVRWKDPDTDKPQNAKVNTDRKDAGEVFFIKSADIKLEKALPEVSDTICSELVEKMASMLD